MTNAPLFDVPTTATAADSAPAYWLGVVCRDHVRRGTGLGIAQLNHGRRGGLERLKPGDWLIYYSPRTSLRGGEPLQAFTAIGEVPDAEIWQADEGAFQPWRRRIAYLDQAHDAPVADFGRALDLTAAPNWGHQLRRGLVRLSAGDFRRIHAAMTWA
jgi:hypothetical protein